MAVAGAGTVLLGATGGDVEHAPTPLAATTLAALLGAMQMLLLGSASPPQPALTCLM